MQSTSTRFHVVFGDHSNSSNLTMSQAVQVGASTAMLTNLVYITPPPRPLAIWQWLVPLGVPIPTPNQSGDLCSRNHPDVFHVAPLSV